MMFLSDGAIGLHCRCHMAFGYHPVGFMFDVCVLYGAVIQSGIQPLKFYKKRIPTALQGTT